MLIQKRREAGNGLKSLTGCLFTCMCCIISLLALSRHPPSFTWIYIFMPSSLSNLTNHLLLLNYLYMYVHALLVQGDSSCLSLAANASCSRSVHFHAQEMMSRSRVRMVHPEHTETCVIPSGRFLASRTPKRDGTKKKDSPTHPMQSCSRVSIPWSIRVFS